MSKLELVLTPDFLLRSKSLTYLGQTSITSVPGFYAGFRDPGGLSSELPQRLEQSHHCLNTDFRLDYMKKYEKKPFIFTSPSLFRLFQDLNIFKVLILWVNKVLLLMRAT